MLKKPEPVKSHGTLLIYSTGIIGILVIAAAYFLSQSDIPWPNLPPGVFSSTAEPSPRVDLTAEEKKNLTDRLKRGDLHLAVGRLIFPEGSNATYSYKRAQEIDPGNPDARRGLEAVQENVLVQLQQLQAQKRMQDMCDELALALRLFPENRSFKKLREESQCTD